MIRLYQERSIKEIFHTMKKVYEGECKNYMYNGKGKIFKNGQLDYDGQWKHNLRHGLGKLYKN